MWSALWCNMRVWFFLCIKTSALTRAAIAPITQQLSCHQSYNVQTEFRKTTAIRIGTFEAALRGRWESGGGGWGQGCYLWKRWRHGVRPAPRWSAGSRERSWTVPGGYGASTDRPAAWLTKLQWHTEYFNLISAGKQKKIYLYIYEKRKCFLNFTLQKKSSESVFIY